MSLETLVLDICLAGLVLHIFLSGDAEGSRDRPRPAGMPSRSLGLACFVFVILMAVPDSYLWSSVPGTLLLLIAAATLTLRLRFRREAGLAETV